MEKKKKSGFSGSLGFVMAAAGSAVGIGNIWRFPYLAAKDGGGVFLLIYVSLIVTFGFTLLVSDVAIGRKMKSSALRVFGEINKKWEFLGYLTFLVPTLIMTYYSVIGGWVCKYAFVYLTNQSGKAASDGFFASFTTSFSPILYMLLFLAISSFIVYRGVEKGIERFSKIIMPGLLVLIIGIGVFSLTLSYTDINGITRTGWQGFMVYVTPDFTGMTMTRFLEILLDAMSQLFFSLSVSMGIMITYGSYVKKDVNLSKSLSQIEIFDTIVAFLAGLLIIPAVFVFFGTEGMTSGPSLMFISLPKVFNAMGRIGLVIGLLFFVMVSFAALTSNISIMETLVANGVEILHKPRHVVCKYVIAYAAITAVIVCLGYNVFYFEMPLPNHSIGQILDVVDYISNSFLMPLISFLTCIFIGWVIKPQWIIQEMEASGDVFTRKKLYAFMIRYVAPVIMFILFLQSTGIFSFIAG